MKDRLEEIKLASRKFTFDDIKWLIAEVERLREINKIQRTANKNLENAIDLAVKQIVELQKPAS